MENADSYITIILQDNEQLKNYLAGYLNNRLALRTLHPNKSLEEQDQYESRLVKEITEQERQTMINSISLFRGYATRLNISLNSLKRKSHFDKELLTQLEEDYKVIKENAAPNYDACERFVQNVNNLLEENIDLKNLVNSVQDTKNLVGQTRTTADM